MWVQNREQETSLNILPFPLLWLRTRSRLHNLLSGITDKTSKRPKNTYSIARLSHEQKVTTFLLFAIAISLCRKQLLDIIVTFAQRNARNFTATSNLLDNPYAKSSFIFILFWVVRRGSVGIVHGPFCRVVRGPGLSGGPWTGGGHCFRVTRLGRRRKLHLRFSDKNFVIRIQQIRVYSHRKIVSN